jgi:hypothetical protein
MLEEGVFVTTDLFEVTTPGKHFINPRCFGEDFAAWLRTRLTAWGTDSSQPIQEDWGWVLLVKHRGHTFTVAIGVMDESIGMVPAEWRVGLSYEKLLNGIRGWFRAAPTEAFSELFQRLWSILSAEPRFTVSETESA